MIRKFIQDIKLAWWRLTRASRGKTLERLKQTSPVRLHLGCGREHLAGWINIDANPGSRADVVLDFREIKDHFEEGTIDEVVMIHSISYLRLWEARDFLDDLCTILKKGGRLVLEFPDAEKCAERLLRKKEDLPEYLEAIRGLYAFGMDQIARKEKFVTYAFGWSAWHMKKELLRTGFSTVLVADPQTHNQMLWRDTRIEATK